MQATEVKPQVDQQAPPAEEASCCAVQAGPARARPWWLIGGAVLAVPLLLYGGWDWLAATGLSTVLIVMAPCLVMCALGLCMGRGKSKGEMSAADIRKTYETQSVEPPNRG